ncbi:tricalbin [Gloeophyllum trabeum ATCC 11539]|uniref:Tricalbin n=1 Tax=Gloeophyllum trabeum (strain ATCC 11539 / FP-39264 / Madison 617) TaxID=670483 RepID=S7QNF5_GLOTA|nr:tricalbin [Gloeophyllum trabeum ATCC 11539]EPQ61056.1 tricalbin [Gloeophyllum trabeum ATCC 11539]
MAASNGSAQAEVNDMVEKDAEKGRVAVHSFDPEAPPEEKAAAAGKARDQLKSVSQKDTGAGGRELAIDTGASNVVPTITIEDADTEVPDEDQNQPQPELPGALPDGVAPAIPDWYKVGWRAVGGIDEPELTEGEEKDKNVLELFISEQFYGDWYHNAAIIIFAVFMSHFLTRFNFGWGWLLIVLACCSTYYSTSIRRVRRRARDDIQRELVKTRLASEHETADWINNFLDRFWLIYEPVLSATIISSVDQILSVNTPAFLDSLRLTTFTLGTKAPRIDKVRTFPKTADDIVMMDWGISFTPNETSDLTERQKKLKVNPKIVLSIRVGKGIAAVTMPVLLEDITFTGLMRIKLKLMTNFPHVQTVDISFLEKPVIEYALKPIGGQHGFDINDIPGLSAFIRDMVHGTLGPMMYDPNVFTLNLEQLLSGAPLDAAIGVVQVTIHSGRSLKGSKIGGGTPDPYVSLSISNRGELARTKYKHSTYNPSWNETKFLLVNSLTDTLVLSVFDYNEHRKNTELGAASFDLSKLQEDATLENLEVEVLKDGKERGMLRFDLSFYPVLKPEVVDGKEELPETTVGIVRLTLHQAKDLDPSKSMTGDLNPFARVYLGDNPAPIHSTTKFRHTLSPVWESATEFLCSDKQTSVVTVKVIDDRDFMKDPVVGYLRVRLADLLAAKKEVGKDWWALAGCTSGRLRMSAEWKPLDMAGSLHGADQYKPPIGVVRLWLDRATDVKNVEAALGGKSDPYVRVQINNITQGRTEVVNNNLNPVWDQIIYIPVHSLRETMLLECMDYQHLTKDRSLGSVELRVSDLAQESEDPEYPYASTGKKEVQDPIKLDRGNSYKGRLHYTAEFIPALALKWRGFSTGGNELQQAARTGGGDEDGGIVLDDDSSSMSSSDIERQAVPLEITATSPVGSTFSKGHAKGAKSTDTARTAVSTGTTGSNGSAAPYDVGDAATSSPNGNGQAANRDRKPQQEEKGIDMSKEDLLRQQSGVVIMNVLNGQLSKKARLEVLLDDGYWPAFSTIKARSTHAKWEHVGEGFIKELDFGRVWLRLNEADEGDKDDVIAEWKTDAKPFLEQALNGPTKFTLYDDDGKATSVVELEARYIPVPVKLEPRESINNQGVLQVTLIDGKDIHGVDRGGKSDPFAVFTLNGQRVFKSQTKKKTLTPEWNESFTVSVPSRVGADFEVEIFDWNQIEQAKKLGSGKIELADIEPFEAIEKNIPLSSQKHGDKGQVRVRLIFQPEIIAKTRKATSTFSTAGRAMTQIGHMPVGAGKGVIHGVGSVFRSKDHAKQNDGLEGIDMPNEPAPGQASKPVGADPSAEMSGAAFPSSASVNSLDANGGVGTLRVTVMDAKDLALPGDTPKPYVVVRVGDKEYKTKHAGKTLTPEWNETLTFSAGPMTNKLYAWIHDHKTLGKDKLLGSGEIDIWRHIQPTGVTSAEVLSDLREGQGLLRLRLEFDADATPSVGRRSSMSSMNQRTTSFSSPSRFSISRKRHPSDD